MAKVSGGGSRIVFGTILVLLGVLLLFSQMGVFEFGDFISVFWPMILIIVGLWQWAIRRFRPSFWPLLLIIVGVFFQAMQFGVLDGSSFGVLIGLAMIGLGVWLVLRKARSEAPQAVTDSDSIDHWVIFGGVEESITSQQFNGGNTTVVFGGAEIDLRKAALAQGDILLNLSAIFGGIEIRVPEDWHVNVDGTAILGGVEDKTGARESDTESVQSKLHIRAVAIFGGIEISR